MPSPAIQIEIIDIYFPQLFNLLELEKALCDFELYHICPLRKLSWYVFKKSYTRASLAVQWLRFWVSIAGSMGLIPDRGKSFMGSGTAKKKSIRKMSASSSHHIKWLTTLNSGGRIRHTFQSWRQHKIKIYFSWKKVSVHCQHTITHKEIKASSPWRRKPIPEETLKGRK